MTSKYVPGKVYFRNKRTGAIVEYEPLLEQIAHMERVIPNPLPSVPTNVPAKVRKPDAKAETKKSDG